MPSIKATNTARPGRKSGFQVVITDLLHDRLGPERERLKGIAKVSALDAYSEADLVGRVEDADAIILYHHLSLTEATIRNLRQCRLIVRGGVGYDNVDLEACRKRGIPVTNVPDYGTEEVADTAIGLALALCRGLHRLNNQLRESRVPWTYDAAVPLWRLRGRVFGIVGLGRIGTAVARRAQALGMDVAFYDPYKPDGYDKACGIRRVDSVRELFRQSHLLSLHCPLTPETRHLINARTLNWLPKGAFLINTARGAVVDTRAIPGALQSGRLGGAALDVLPGEPPSPQDPLLEAWKDPDHAAHDGLILNPHTAFYSEEGLLEIREKTAEACRRALLGQPLKNRVD